MRISKISHTLKKPPLVIDRSPSPSLNASSGRSSPNPIHEQYKEGFILKKMKIDERVMLRAKSEYLAHRPLLMSFLDRANEVMRLSDHCYELTARILDRFAINSQKTSEAKIIETMVGGCVLIASKLVTDVWIPISTISKLLQLSQEQLILMEQYILEKVDYEVYIPTILEYYQALYGSQPSQLLLDICRSSELLNENKLHLAMALKKLQDKIQAFQMIFGDEGISMNVVEEVKTFLGNISPEK